MYDILLFSVRGMCVSVRGMCVTISAEAFVTAASLLSFDVLLSLREMCQAVLLAAYTNDDFLPWL